MTTWGSRRTRERSERGSAPVEVVILVPMLVLFIGLIIGSGRFYLGQSAVRQAAAASARAAAISRDAGSAKQTGRAIGMSSLGSSALECSSRSVNVDTHAFAQQIGTPGRVTATVSCTVAFSDLSLPGMPGEKTLTATANEPLDRYRARRP